MKIFKSKEGVFLSILTILLLSWGIVYTNCGSSINQQESQDTTKTESISAIKGTPTAQPITSPNVDCIYGYVWNGTECVPIVGFNIADRAVYCPSGTYYNGTDCVSFPIGVVLRGTDPTAVQPGDPIIDCMYGFVWNGIKCVPIGGFYEKTALNKLVGTQFTNQKSQYTVKFLEFKSENDCEIVPAKLVDQTNLAYHLALLKNPKTEASNTMEFPAESLGPDTKCGAVTVAFEVIKAGNMKLIKSNELAGKVFNDRDGKRIKIEGMKSPLGENCWIDESEVSIRISQKAESQLLSSDSNDNSQGKSVVLGFYSDSNPMSHCHGLCFSIQGNCCDIFGLYVPSQE